MVLILKQSNKTMRHLSKFGFIILSAIFLSLGACNGPVEKKSDISMDKKEMKDPKNEKLLRHVVLFNFNNDATQEITQKIEQKFVALKAKISAIHSFEWGTNNSPEGLDKGLTHCFFVTFLTEEDRSTYLPHPDHLEFVEFIGPYVEDVTVVDYWTE